MKERVLEFDNIKEMSKCDIFDDKEVSTIKTHFDKEKKKYITKIEYEKK